MTKSEAIARVMEINKNAPYDFLKTREYAKSYVNAMETLGFIKFGEDEEKTDVVFTNTPHTIINAAIVETSIMTPTTVIADRVINKLRDHGYLIVRNDRHSSSEKGNYIFFPNPDAHKDNVSVLQKDAVATMKKYGYAVFKSLQELLDYMNEHGYTLYAKPNV